MTKRKLQRFAEIATFSNVFQHKQFEQDVQDFPLKGTWNKEYFKNDYPIIIELGCGKGEYTVGMAEKFKDKNFIGIDLKGNRIWRGAKTALENKLHNVAFLRSRIENIEKIFEPGEVSEIWITFPDPQPQLGREKKRLTSPLFLSLYRNLLKPDGVIHLKTDNAPLYEYTLEKIRENNFHLLGATSDLYKEQENLSKEKHSDELFSIKTFYEKKFSDFGFKICYLKFSQLPASNLQLLSALTKDFSCP